jgi:hypothetical protein
MEDLIPYLSESLDVEFIQRSRRWLSKTFDILLKILRANGDLFHVSYALQDAYLVDKLKHHLDILHIHGSDVRWIVHRKKYGWIVKSNLKHAGKVLYATPDLQQAVEKFRPDAIYLPTPVKTSVFKMKSRYNDPPKAVYFKLAYEKLPPELEKALAKSNISLTVMERNAPYEKMPEILQAFDIFIDRFTIPSLSKTCLEAMSCGLATIDFRHVINLVERVEELSDVRIVRHIGQDDRRFAQENHDVRKIARQLLKIYEESV